MSDKKISQLTALTGANTASNDVLPIVDTSATETKKITLTELQSAPISAGTANGVAYLNGSKVLTTGSALTFDGTNLYTPKISTELYAQISATIGRTGDFGQSLELVRSGVTGNAGFGLTAQNQLGFYLNSTEQMRLTSTGLGIGTSSPNAKLEVNGNVILGSEVYRSSDSSYMRIAGGNPATNGANIIVFGSTHATAPGRVSINALGTGDIRFSTGAGPTEVMRLDSSGNLGLGVTPSAWTPTYRKAIQVNTYSALSGDSYYGLTDLSNNAYESATGTWKYISSAPASYYRQDNNGRHQWYTAPSGTAGNAISFTQAMTLDASGNLGIGATTVQGKLHINSASNTLIRVTAASGVAGVDFGTEADVDNGRIRYDIASSAMTFSTADTERMRIDSSGNLITNVNGTAPTLTTNSTMSFELTNNTTLKIKVRGTDGTTRSVTLTLA